jgi:hypothetical protein
MLAVFQPGVWQPDRLDTFGDEIRRFHLVLEDLGSLLEQETPRNGIALASALANTDPPVLSKNDPGPPTRAVHGHPISL